MIATLARRMLSSAAGNTPTRLTGQVALVTASTAGIGLGIAERLGREGAKVVVCSRKAKNVDETVASLKSMGIDVVGMPAHVGKPEDRTALLDFTMAEFGRLDVLVSNAAVNPVYGPILKTMTAEVCMPCTCIRPKLH